MLDLGYIDHDAPFYLRMIPNFFKVTESYSLEGKKRAGVQIVTIPYQNQWHSIESSVNCHLDNSPVI